MAGKRVTVPKRISILAEDEVAALPELQELAAKGHEVMSFSEYDTARYGDGPTVCALDRFDLILSKSACAYREGMAKYLADTVKGARARRYGVAKGLETEV